MSHRIRKATLDNGLRVVVENIPGATGAGVSVHYRAGFRVEVPTRAGFAHLFEHMMFQGSEHVDAGEHFARVTAVGGSINGNTLPDSADYHQVVPVPALDEVLALEADRMHGLTIDRRNFETQRSVVKEEIRLQVEGKPYGGFPWTTLPSVLYRGWANAHNGYGEPADLDAATVDDCADFYRDHYAPGNAVLAVCGDLGPDHDDVLAAVRRAFGGVPPRPVADRPDLSEPPAGHPLRGTCRCALAPRPAVAIGTRLPDASRDLEGYAAHVVLSRLLTGGNAARLRRALAPSEVLVDSSVGLFGPLHAADPDTFVVVAHVPAGLEEPTVRTITEHAAAVADGTAAGAETRRAVAVAGTRCHQNLDSLQQRVRHVGRGELLFGDPGIADDLADAVSRTTDADVARAAATLADEAGRAVLTLRPGVVAA